MLFTIILLSFIQGISEFLPISSAGHLFLIEKFLNFQQGGLVFDLALNLGTALTLIVYFYKYILLMIKEVVSLLLGKNKNYKNLLFIKLIIATLPVTLAGLILVKLNLEVSLRTPIIVGSCLIIFGIILYVIDIKYSTNVFFDKISYKNAFFIGLLQCLSLIPGVSRSGITITTARFNKIERKSSVIFSFLIAIPSTLGAVILMGFKVHKQSLSINYYNLLLGVLFSFIFGMLFIHLLLKFITKYNFAIFMIYRIILGIFVIIYAILS